MAEDRTPSPRADVCIVGAGPAGAIVAARLAEAGHDVVVLDAGPRFDLDDRTEQLDAHVRPGIDSGGRRPSGSEGSEIPRATGEAGDGRPATGDTRIRSDEDDADVGLWGMGGERDDYTSSGPKGYPLNAARVKGVGGSTLHWQGMVMRLHERDFELRSRHGVGVDWPLDYADLRPYYAEAERELGVAGADDNPFAPPRSEPFPLPAFPPSHSDAIFAEACESLGLPTHSVPNARNSEPYDGASACAGYGTCKPVCPSGAKYTAERHVARAEAAGARVVDRAPVQRLVHGPEGDRIEAAVYATPDGEEHRQDARAVVLACGGVENVRLLLLSASDAHPDGLANSSGLVGRYFMDHCFAGVGGRIDRQTRQNHVGFNTTECHALYDATDPLPGVKLEFLNYAGPSPVIEALHADDWGDSLLDSLRDSYGTHLAVGGLVEQFPRAENRITLDPSTTDDHGNPVPDVRWSVGPETRTAIERVNEVQRSILEELGADIDWVVGPDETGPAYHHMGTTRMGTDPAESVVAPDCRAHDCKNLWIAGSSVFPTGGAMNPTLTIAALACRLADRLDRWL